MTSSSTSSVSTTGPDASKDGKDGKGDGKSKSDGKSDVDLSMFKKDGQDDDNSEGGEVVDTPEPPVPTKPKDEPGEMPKFKPPNDIGPIDPKSPEGIKLAETLGNLNNEPDDVE